MEMAQLTTSSSSLQQSIGTSSKEMNIFSKPFSILIRIIVGKSLHQSDLCCYSLGHFKCSAKAQAFSIFPLPMELLCILK